MNKSLSVSRIKLLISLAASWVIVLWAAPAQSQVEVITSIKPLQLIVQEIVGQRSSVGVVVGSAGSPHDYSLRISDIEKIKLADLVVWVGPHLENFLVKPVQKYARHSLIVGNLPGVRISAEEHQHGERDSHDEAELNIDEDLLRLDPHIWLDPIYAKKIIEITSLKLIELDPSAAQLYRANAEKFTTRLDDLDRNIRSKLSNSRDKGFYVFHDGYGYFVERYQLRQLGSFKFSPETSLSVRQLTVVKEAIDEKKVSCIFQEPQYNGQFIEELHKNSGVRIAALDPLAMDILVEPGGYINFLQKFSTTIYQCLNDEEQTGKR